MKEIKLNKTILILGIALIVIIAILFSVLILKESKDSMIKRVTTENGESIEFNLLHEWTGTTWYQSDFENLTKDECQQQGIEYSNQYANYFSDDLTNFKQYNQFYYDEDNSLVFCGEVYKWETEEYTDSAKAEIILDRTGNNAEDPDTITANKGFVLVKFYTYEDELDSGENRLLIKSKINGKRTVVRVLKDYYPDNRKSYRVHIENNGDEDSNILIIADNVDEQYIIELIEHLSKMNKKEVFS